MNFVKYHGLGNDFVVVDLRAGDGSPPVQDGRMATALCDRRFGIGADGVLAILPTPDADARMRVLNADGSEAEMCGNGIRCVAKHLYEQDQKLRKSPLRIVTGAGTLSCELTVAHGVVEGVSVDMGRPRLTRGEIPVRGPSAETFVERSVPILDKSFLITGVSMGNPHAVTFVDESAHDLRMLAERYGRALETHEIFPPMANLALARVASPTEIELVVWERGCGITLACGTGACAAATAACLTGRAQTGTPIDVRLLGGTLRITVATDYSTVIMVGTAKRVYEGAIDLATLPIARS